MRKRISVDQLRTGMYLQEICGSWMEHPFWRKSFLIREVKDLQTLRDCGITEVWIDTAKGKDVAEGQARTEVEATIDHQFQEVAAEPPRIVERTSLADEVRVATRIVAHAKEAVSSMFHEARMGRALDGGDALSLVEDISASVYRNPGAIISLARLKNKDEYTYMHSVAVCALMVSLARQLDLDEQQTRAAGLAGLLHDVGKMAIPDEILNKPGNLTDDEFARVKTHPEEGHKMLLEGRNIDTFALDVCLHHHEKMDGTGYPGRLKADEISLFARMGAVCDVYDAITSNRPYKAGWDPAESMRKMAEWTGHFDSQIFQAFVKSLGIYPTGSLVRLESGRLAIVVEQSGNSLLTPLVRAFFSLQANSRITPELVDLSRPHVSDKIIAREDVARWGFKNLDELWISAGESH
ncbi:MAG: HD-GYP domain-containing protein [Proteobacteria bacterium]|nr:HD-GYP domain-containing protein [Pseudomonadota bacterium]HQR04809.1 HD-GYP domain-containing protein [Rhodocyclaceae bacterium]